jgi:hypothetical protein
MTTDTWQPGTPLYDPMIVDATAEQLYSLKGADCLCSQSGQTRADCADRSWDAARWPIPQMRYDLDEDEA